MIRDDDARAHGVMLTILGVSKIQQEALVKVKSSDPETVGVDVGFQPMAYAERNGHLYVINNEGVGWEVSDDKPLPLDIFTHTEHSFSAFPALVAHLGPAEVKECGTGQQIDLADLVRIFGSRLESNFWTWHAILTADPKEEP